MEPGPTRNPFRRRADSDLALAWDEGWQAGWAEGARSVMLLGTESARLVREHEEADVTARVDVYDLTSPHPDARSASVLPERD